MMFPHRPLLLLALLSISCADDREPAGSIDVRVRAPSQPELPEAAGLAVTIWGYDNYVADASASVVHAQTLPIDALPIDVAVLMPDDPHTLIDQGFGPVAAEDSRYYLTVRGDLDGDGQICAGELVQDFDSSDILFFGPGLPTAPIAIPLVALPVGSPCEDAFPTGG